MKKYLYILLSMIIISCFIRPSYSADYSIRVNIPSRTLEIWDDNTLIKTYPVGVGRKRFPTPTGHFEVLSKISVPTWENPYKPAGEARIYPGQKNPLGTRWIGFYRNSMGEYGIHGTNEPTSVGTFCSHGCIRMRINNSESLYDNVSIGTPVEVTYYTYKLKVKGHKILIYRYPDIYNRKISADKMIYEQLEQISLDYTLDFINIDRLKTLNIGKSIQIGEIAYEE